MTTRQEKKPHDGTGGVQLRNLKVAMATFEYSPARGGIGSHAFHLSNSLAELGTSVDIFTCTPSSSIPTPHQKITIHQVPFIHAPVVFSTYFGENAVARFLPRQDSFDVFHSHYGLFSASGKTLRRIKIPKIATMHGTWKSERISSLQAGLVNMGGFELVGFLTNRFLEFYEKVALRAFDRIITVSEYNRRELLNSYGSGADLAAKVTVIPSGVDTDQFKPRSASYLEKYRDHLQIDDKFVLLYVGRLVARKGITDLLSAMSSLARMKSEVVLIIVGSGHLKNWLMRRAWKLRIASRVIFLGSARMEDLPFLYSLSDLFVLPSYYEAQGIVILEAMASGVPIISTWAGGIPEMVTNGRNGLLVNAGDPSSLVNAVISLMENSGLRREMANNNRERALEHDWKLIARRVDEAYRNTLKEFGR